jgi:hypothetical protein
MSRQLQRLILIFKPEGVEIRTLYRSKDGLNPGTKARGKVVADLARSGLRDAREGFLLAGGEDKDWPSQEKQIRAELVRDEAKAAAQAAHAEAFGQTKRNF